MFTNSPFFPFHRRFQRLPPPPFLPPAIPAATTRRFAGKPRAVLTFYFFLALRYFQRPLATSDMLPPFHVVSTSSFCQVNTGQRQFILIPRCGSPVFMSASCTSPTSPHAPPTCCHVDHVLIQLPFFY
uniref:Uncharacterized protein n=1 Tax=Cucumis sativus TaxID=3659 RepID=A0A0A0K1E5_CUCSA